MKLLKPTKTYEQSWQEALAEFQSEGYKGFWNYQTEPTKIENYIQLTSAFETGKNLPADKVPSSTYWLIENDTFVGHVNIRHQLNDYLERLGGHIGYAIRPSARKKRYGTKILKLALTKARELRLKKVLITCDESNLASQKIIEKNGGQFQDKVPGESEPKLRYWIEL